MNRIQIGLILFFSLLCFFIFAYYIYRIIYVYTEKFVAYSGFKQTGRKNKEICKNYFLNLYRNCIRNSGGVDYQGNCLARIQPNLISCYYGDY